jgi:two-component system, OmpR family, sensor kinase
MRRFSLQVRLFLLTLTVFACGLALSGLVVSALMRQALMDRLDRSFGAMVPIVAAQVSAEGVPGFDPAGRIPVPISPSQQSALRLSVAGAYIRAVDENGRVLAEGTVPDVGDGPKPQGPAIPADLTTSINKPFTVQGTGPGATRTYRVLVEVLRIDNVQATILIALPLTDLDATMQRIIRYEFLVGGTALALIAAIVWAVTRFGLRPLREIENAAEEIGREGYPSPRRIAHPADKTELGRLGARLNTMLDTIDEAFRQRARSEARLRRFVSDASHELRTPLTSIRGYAQLSERSGGDPDVTRSSLARISQESTRMSVLVEDLMTLARLDEDPVLERSTFDLREVVATAVADARAVDHGRTWRFLEDGPVMVHADQRRIAQVVLNLLTNARTHTRSGVAVDARVWLDGNLAHVAIIDRGDGVPADVGAQVFDRFYRTEESRTRASGGAGLGLAIVESIVEAHDGSIRLTETQGGGATFTVTLPAI